MAGSQPMICLIRLIAPLTSSREEQMASLQGSSCSIMHPVTRSGPQMPCQHGTCPKGQTSTGLASKMALRCDQVCMSLGRLKYSITPIAIQLCPAGSKGWKTSFRREVCGQPMDSEPSAKASNVSRPHQLLLPSSLILPTQLHCSEVSAQIICHFMWSHM